MKAVLAVIIIVISCIVSAANQKNKVRSRNARSSFTVQKPNPAAKKAQNDDGISHQEIVKEEPEEEELPESDHALQNMDNGRSRECEHGSVGGSMDITTHEGGTDFEHAQVHVKAHVRPEYQQEDDDTVIGEVRRLDARDMRRAVVVSEILKRPDERTRERRWR